MAWYQRDVNSMNKMEKRQLKANPKYVTEGEDMPIAQSAGE